MSLFKLRTGNSCCYQADGKLLKNNNFNKIINGIAFVNIRYLYAPVMVDDTTKLISHLHNHFFTSHSEIKDNV